MSTGYTEIKGEDLNVGTLSSSTPVYQNHTTTEWKNLVQDLEKEREELKEHELQQQLDSLRAQNQTILNRLRELEKDCENLEFEQRQSHHSTSGIFAVMESRVKRLEEEKGCRHNMNPMQDAIRELEQKKDALLRDFETERAWTAERITEIRKQLQELEYLREFIKLPWYKRWFK